MKDFLQCLVGPSEKFAKNKAELKDVEARASQAQRDLAAASTNMDLSEKEAYRVISECNATLETVKIRTVHLRKQRTHLFEELRAALKNANREWSQACEVSAKVIETRFIKANVKFFNGDAEAARAVLSLVSLPGTDWRNRLWLEDDQPITEDNIWVLTRRFVQHVQLFLKDLAIGPDEPVKPAGK